MRTLRDRGLSGGEEGTAGTEPTYLGEGSSTRPWRPLGPEPRDEAPAGATRVTAGTRTSASYAALWGLASSAQTAALEFKSEGPAPRRPGLARSGVTSANVFRASRTPEARAPASPGLGCVSGRRVARAAPGDTWSLFLSTEGGRPGAPRHSSRDALRGKSRRQLTPRVLTERRS